MNAVVFYFRCIFIFKNSMFLIVIAHVNDLLLSRFCFSGRSALLKPEDIQKYSEQNKAINELFLKTGYDCAVQQNRRQSNEK